MKQLLTFTLAAAVLTVTACGPGRPGLMGVVDSPDSKPACVGDTVLIDWFEDETACDLVPPQMLVKRMPDLTDESHEACHLRGGNVMVDNAGGTAYCLNLDY